VPQPEDISLDGIGGRRVRTPEYSERTTRDSTFSGSTPTGSDYAGNEEIIVTPLSPAPPFAGIRTGYQQQAFAPEVMVQHTAASSAETLTSPDPGEAAASEAETHPANGGDQTANPTHIGYETPPHASDARVERRRQAREEARNRHRGIHAAPPEFDDSRMWVE